MGNGLNHVDIQDLRAAFADSSVAGGGCPGDGNCQLLMLLCN